MSSELLAVFEYLEREKGIPRRRIIDAIESSLITASKKAIQSHTNLSVTIDPNNADIKVFAEVEVVGYPTDDPDEIYLDDALHIDETIKEGDHIKIEVTPKNFGRIAAQTAKQVIIQKLREAEKDMIIDEFRVKVGQLVTGVVRRHSSGSIVVDVDKAEAIIPPEEQVPTERYHYNMRVTAMIFEVRDSEKGAEIILTRRRPELITKLFELEIPEIAEKTVEIKSIAREAGHRTKIAVTSKDSRIDCVGACVGMRGTRVKNIVRELNGEKIDIIRWDPDIITYIKEALSPCVPIKTEYDADSNIATVVVKDDEYSLAIGKQGQNARLTAKLVGCKVDIINETRYEKKGHKLIERLMEIPGIDRKLAEDLSEVGFQTLEEIAEAEISRLTAVAGLGERTAMKIQELIRLNLESDAPEQAVPDEKPEGKEKPAPEPAELDTAEDNENEPTDGEEKTGGDENKTELMEPEEPPKEE